MGATTTNPGLSEIMSFERIVHCVRLVFHRKGLRARVVECNVDIAAIVRVLVSVNVVLVNERRDLDPARLAPVDYRARGFIHYSYVLIVVE